MRHHADELVRPLGADQKARIDEDVHAAGDEGVDVVDVQQIDMHRMGIEARRDEDRVGELADRGLDLRIADDAGAPVAGGLRRRACGPCDERRQDQQGDGAAEPPLAENPLHIGSFSPAATGWTYIFGNETREILGRNRGGIAASPPDLS